MRLEITASDRLGIVQDILDILVQHGIDLRGIEVYQGSIYLNFPEIDFSEFQHLMPEMRRLPGIEDVKTTKFMPFEREHCEFATILRAMPDPVFSIDSKGHVQTANDAALRLCGDSLTQVYDEPISHWLKGFSFSRWLDHEQIETLTKRVQLNHQEFLADIYPIWVPDGDNKQVLAGAVISLKSELRFGEQISAFRRPESDTFGAFISHSSAMRKCIREAKKLSVIEAPMLIEGETGAGKELLAKACHKASKRADNDFVVLNCASLPDEVAESELFGYAAHAYEHHSLAKKGLFEIANGGTVFLDEVGEMSSALQVKLLRLLQDGCFRRIGDDQEVQVDVKILCATKRDLSLLVQDGTFREDLFYRLNVLSVKIPPLRERKADIISLAELYIRKVSQQSGRAAPRMSKACQDYLLQYPWPGNVRQLENTIYRAVSLLDGDEMAREHVELPAYASDLGYVESEVQGTLEESIKRFESSLLKRLYPSYPSTRQLAKKLGLSHTAIANKLREYGINKKTMKTY
ncbi:transcriptional regulator TyrR [Saccharobesus litoralis]|uniref:HTH-type transcriptional regulatory protein TyrR n=1 Tax=Saccharobesus litoralis TaxID=2172099 RepID=A0A2S0VSF0_9ALTE|nr:transcriptional regulator TyrR [Saccharobesus litoralis]AWB67113.1 transcriptional regulator TyrR [Saccharobesus litoralis]